MEQRKTFLQTLQETINKLKKDGIISKEELEQKIDIPIEWLYSNGIQRKTIILAMNNILERINPAYKKNINGNISIDHIRICERNKKIIIEVPGTDNWTYFCLADEKNSYYHKNRKVPYFNSEEFVHEIYKIKQSNDEKQLKKDVKSLSTEELIAKMNMMYNTAKRDENLKDISSALVEMMENFGEYYKYLQQEKMSNKPNNITHAGLVANEIPDAKSSEGTFQERKKIFMDLNPEKVVIFSSVNEKKKIESEVYMGYVYKNYRENEGYFLMIEPLGENMPTRAIYLTNEMIEKLQKGLPGCSNFWEILARIYVEKTEEEFRKEKCTYRFNHTGLDNYAAKIKYIISGEIAENVPMYVINSARMNLTKLFGNDINLADITKNVSEKEIEQARKQIHPRQIEKEMGGRD